MAGPPSESGWEHLAAVVESSGDALITTHLDGTIETWSRGAERLFGYRDEEVVGHNVSLLVPGDRPDDVPELMQQVAAGDVIVGHETSRLRKDGVLVEVALALAPIRDDGGEVVRTSVIARDITSRKRAQGMLAYQAEHDILTGLANRSLLSTRLEDALESFEQDPDGELVVLFLDLDRFKVVNESRGHAAGDAVLVTVARRLRQAVQPGDTVARFGGDEFVVLCEEAGLEHGKALARRIAELLEVPIELDGMAVVPSASIGLVVGGAGDSAEGLLSDADAAMYVAKARGRARVEVFDVNLRDRSNRRLTMEAALRRALDEGELHVEYQPIVSLRDGVTVGAEALVRWESPVPEWSQPDAFIPIAEETGLIVEVGDFVLREVIAQLEDWKPHFRPDDGFSISVNLSALQLRPSLADATFDLRNHGLDPKRITFELTESVLLEDSEASMEALLGLKLVGVQLAIDDFGTGYSSLSYLQRLPVSKIKIDRSFVVDLGKKPHARPLVAAILAMAEALDLSVVAEGVETAEQAAILEELGCSHGQGFYWGRSVGPAEFAACLPAGTATAR